MSGWVIGDFIIIGYLSAGVLTIQLAVYVRGCQTYLERILNYRLW